MAKSPSHEFGQIIGNILEDTTESLLKDCAKKHNLFLDKKGIRPARKGKKVSWIDIYGNKHDLDFVIEKGGTENKIGIPIAFIESAWRRYTKHSRNKSQEIQGAIMPVVANHHLKAPFIGVVLAGVFTDGALNQLKSLGFAVLYLNYDSIIEAFSRSNIDAFYDEDTPEEEFNKKIKAWKNLGKNGLSTIINALQSINEQKIKKFIEDLENAIKRSIKSIRIIPLHGEQFTLSSIKGAIDFINEYDEIKSNTPIVKYEITIVFDNGDKIEGNFNDKTGCINFLNTQIIQYSPLSP
jgi:hypothetical protein